MMAIACGGATFPSTADPELGVPTIATPFQVVPSAGLPSGYTDVAGMSNNNLDVVVHSDGLTYLALRTSKDHFASDQSRIVVLSSADQTTWTWEATFSFDSDARECRLLSYKGRLFVFMAQLGTSSGSFDPHGMFVSERLGPQNWTDKHMFYGDATTNNFIPWRVKVRHGRAFMTAYRGGQHIYDFSGDPIDVVLLVSDDGDHWAPFNPKREVVSTGGGSETDFDFDSHGDLYAVVRNEAGDDTGFGMKICRADASDITKWECKHDPKKYDSPLVYNLGDDRILLIGRRNLTDTGNYELHPGQEWSLAAYGENQLSYSSSPKRCALWQLDRASLTVRYIVDLPGFGDTCFASILPDAQNPNHVTVYNYSSPLDGDPTISWMMGQHGETRIYRMEVTFP